MKDPASPTASAGSSSASRAASKETSKAPESAKPIADTPPKPSLEKFAASKAAPASDTLVATAVAEARADAKTDVPKAATKPQAETVTPSAPEQQSKKQGGIFWPLVLGGIVAGGIGFGAAELNLLGLRGDDGTAELRSTVTDQQQRLAALESAEPQSAQSGSDNAALDDLTAQVVTLKDDLATLSGRLGEVDQRLTAVEKRPVGEGTSNEAVAAYERDLAALQASVAEQQREIEALRDNATTVVEATENAARGAALQSALTGITAAISEGRPFAQSLAELQMDGVTDIPDALTASADTGVATLNSLQARFPDSARAALADARANGAGDQNAGILGFMRRQLGARSVAPREGNDPDAVLSRAEAALRDGRLGDTLAEVDTLPESSQAAMTDWLADARARQSASAAVQDLSDRLTATQGN